MNANERAMLECEHVADGLHAARAKQLANADARIVVLTTGSVFDALVVAKAAADATARTVSVVHNGEKIEVDPGADLALVALASRAVFTTALRLLPSIKEGA